MPFVGEYDDELVTPHMVDKEDAVVCPACEEEMTVRDEHRRDGSFVARHFVHHPDVDCDGESDEHMRMKAIAHSKLESEYPEATVHVEEEVGDRQADLLVEFPESRDPTGQGIAVEVQHRNKSKHREATTEHYLANSYSVLWLYDYHFRGMDVRVDHAIPVWPNVVDHVDLREVYPDAVRFDGWPPVRLNLPLPEGHRPVGRKGRRDLRWHWLLGRVNDLAGTVEPPVDNGQWHEAYTTRLGIDGGRGEITLLDTPDGGQVVQFFKRGDQYADYDLGVRLAPREDVPGLVKFAIDVDELWSAAEEATGNAAGVWEEQCLIALGGGDYRTKWVEFCTDPDGKPALKLCKKDPQEPDIPIRVDQADVETLFEIVAVLAARNDVRHIQRVGDRIVRGQPTTSN